MADGERTKKPGRPAIHDDGLGMLRDRLYSRRRPAGSEGRKPFSDFRREAHGESPSESPSESLRETRNETQGAAGRETHEESQDAAPGPDKERPVQEFTTMTRTKSTQRSTQDEEALFGGYRSTIILAALGFFGLALLVSTAFLFFGQNTISGANIAIDVEAPRAVAGGETLELEITVTNNNSVPVEAATLIVEYPPGTQAADESREVFRERSALGTIAPGEALMVPATARVFGEEDAEKVIDVSVEYRVEGSNATFFREADPVRVTISSSPVILSVDSVREISSGQEFVLEYTIASNSPSPLEDLLVEVRYPQGFEVIGSTPSPVKGQGIWRLGELAPEAEETITVRGVLSGASAGERTFVASVGVPDERDRFGIASVLTVAETTVTLTDPFVGLSVLIGGSAAEVVSATPEDRVRVAIVFENTLADTIYDGAIEVALAGSGLDPSAVDVTRGFFDSSSRVVRWDSAGVAGLGALAPGARQEVTFTIARASASASRTPEITLDVSVSGRRVSESRVPQELSRVASRTIRYETTTALEMTGLHSIGPFANGGPMPPRAEQETEYAVVLTAQNGSNELADASVTLSLPPYVSWRSQTSGEGSVGYNPASREVTWTIGTVSANAAPSAAFQIALRPSVSQVQTSPIIAGSATLRATDRFTGTMVRATAPSITTRLSEDPDSDARDGTVES